MAITKLIAATALLLVLQVQADTLRGKVINVADGDTITVQDDTHTQHKIRLAGNDELEKKQPFGNVSKQRLGDQLGGKAVEVDWSKIDKYGRKVGKVLVGEQDANLEQIKRGLAWHYKQYQREQSAADRQTYADAEKVAKAAQIELWKDPAPQAPH
jgi:endonuclease YncB( thermonuclease family)